MFATIYLPNFYLQAVLRHYIESQNHPVAVIDETNPKSVIIQLNEVAEAVGVSIRMTPSQALARCMDLKIKGRNRGQENHIQEILIEAAFSLTPFVESTAPGVCTVQFTQSRDIEKKVARAIHHLSQCDIDARGGIAASADASLLAAHLAKSVVTIDDAKDFLAPLPIETLSILTG